MSKNLKGSSNLMQFAATNGVLQKKKLEKLAEWLERKVSKWISSPAPKVCVAETFQNVQC